MAGVASPAGRPHREGVCTLAAAAVIAGAVLRGAGLASPIPVPRLAAATTALARTTPRMLRIPTSKLRLRADRPALALLTAGDGQLASGQTDHFLPFQCRIWSVTLF